MAIEYIISAKSIRMFNFILIGLAHELKHKPQALYVREPDNPVEFREELRGRDGFRQDQLLGWFSNKELEHLTRR